MIMALKGLRVESFIVVQIEDWTRVIAVEMQKID